MLIEIPDVGAVEFPDNFDDDQLSKAAAAVYQQTRPDEFGIGQEVRGVGRAVQRGALAADQRLTALGLDRNLDNARTAASEYNEAAAALADFDRQAAANPAFAAAGQAWRQRQLGKLTELGAEVDRRLPQVQAAIPRIARREQQIQAIPPSPDMASLGTDFWRTLASNPVETIATVVAESLPQAVPGMVAGAVMGGPVGMAAGAGANSLGMEYAGAILDSARKRGVNIADPQQLSAFVQDESALADARGFALKRGLPVAAFDAATAGLAGRFLNPAIGQGRRAVAVATAKELGTQMAGGMMGETTGQLASEGRITSVPDIVLEGIAELGGAPAEVFGNLRNEVSSRVREQMGGGMAKDQGPIAQADNELPDFREPLAAGGTEQGAGPELPDSPLPAPRSPRFPDIFDTFQGAAESVPAEGFTPIDQAVRQSRLGRMDPAAGVAEAVPAEGWTPVTSFIRREQMRPRPVTPETAAPEPGPTPEQRKASQEFDRLLIEIGPEAGWVDNLDALAPQMETAKQDATTITARLARGAELRKLRFRAAQAFGLDAAKMNLDVRERAQLLPALQAYAEKVIVPQRQADSLTAAIQPAEGKVPVNTSELSVGDVLYPEGSEPVRVDGVDPDTGEVTLQDGTRFGRTTIADGQTIYVENVEQVAASTDFAPEMVAPVAATKNVGGEGVNLAAGITFYHGTKADFDVRDINTSSGAYFSQNRSYAERPTMGGEGGRILIAGLKMTNPLVFQAGGRLPTMSSFYKLTPEKIAEYKSKGYDSLQLKHPDGTIQEAVIFDRSQILPAPQAPAILAAPESVADQRARQEREAAQASTDFAPVEPANTLTAPNSANTVAQQEGTKAAKSKLTEPTATEFGQMREAVVAKQGKVAGTKYLKAVDRLFPAAGILQYRTAGPVINKGGRAMLQVLADTDSHHSKWRVASEIDVTDQFQSAPPPAPGVLDAPESVADQRARQEREAAQAKAKADRETLAERQAKPLTGSVGDIGATDMLDASKNDLFSAPAPKAKQLPMERSKVEAGDVQPEGDQNKGLMVGGNGELHPTARISEFGPGKFSFNSLAEQEGKLLRRYPMAEAEALTFAKSLGFEVSRTGVDGFGNPVYDLVHPPTLKAQELRKLEAERTNADNWAAAKKGTPVFVRFGKLPPGGLSHNARDNVSEQGVSVYRGWKSGGRVFVDWSEVDRVSAQFIAARSPDVWLVEGTEVGKGSDGEPIIANAKAKRWKNGWVPLVSRPPAQSPADKAIAALEALKVDTAGKVFDAIQGIPVAVWNGALSAAQLALRAGQRVAQAIDAALAYIRAQHRGDFDEAAVRAELENSLQQRQFAEQIDAAPDIAQPVKDATTNRFYTRKPNESTAAFAGRIITGVGGAQQAVAVFTDATNGLGGAERAMLGQLIVKQLSAAGQHEAAARFLDDTFLPYTTEAAQTLQAFAAFANLTPEGALIYAKRQFNRAQRQPRERIQPTLDTAVDVLGDLNRQGIEATVKDGKVQAEAGDTVTDAVVADGRKPGSRLQRAVLTESADRMRRSIVRPRGPDSLRTRLAKLASRDGYWKTLVKGQQKSLTSALMLALGLKPQQQLLTGTVSQLAADLGRVLRQQAEATLARQRTPVTPRTARQQLLTLLLNSERMSEVWAGVRATLEAEGKTDPNVLRVLGTTMDVWSKPLLAQVAREYLKTADVNLAELVRNHYIETTDGRPQATLAAKIVDWLGVSEEAAKPLAAAFDTVLREEAEKVRAGLRKRIDAVKRDPRWKRTLASGIADPDNLPDTEVDAALMQAIREQRVQLGRLVREHFRTVDATGKSLADRVAAVSGVSPERAKRLAAVVQARFAERVKAAKAAAIGRIEQVQAVPREVKQSWQRLVELSNLGALDRETAWNAVAERLKLPQWTPEIAAETQRLAQRVAETPEGINRQRRVIELHNYLAKATGVPAVDTVLAFWYANTLSGPTTQAVNLLANVQNLVANLAVAARSPRDFVAQLAGVGRGLQQGGREAAEVLRTGILTRPGNTKLAPSRPLELLQLPGRLDYLLTPFRLVGRALAAGDSLFFHAGQESRAVLLARQLARSEGLSGPALQRRVAETLGRTSRQRFRAVRQALREGLTGPDLARRVDDLTQQQRPEGLNDNARDYALRLTFNQKPYGFLGGAARMINYGGTLPFIGLPLRLVVPFTNVVANVANESLNYVPPIGVARAVWGHWKGTLEGQPITDRNALGDQWAKAALGTVLLGMVWAAAEGGLDEDDPWFMVNGAGPRESSKKNQLRATGWIPFSLKLGNRYVSFANSPVAMPLAAVGNYFDARRYRHLDNQDAWNRVAYAFKTMGKVILEQSFLDGIARIVGTLDRDNVDAGKELAQSIGRTAGNFVIPNAVRQVDRFFDPTVYDAPTTESALINSVPYARRLNRPALNVWGEPVRNELSKRFASQPTDDALLTMLARRGLWISAPSRTQTEHLNGQPMTPDEFYEFTKVRGQALKRLASRPGTAEALQNLPEEQAQRLWHRLQTTATRQAKAKVRPTR